MRNFRFDDIWILSTKERRGLGLTFRPGTNLVVGKNHTGKSTIIKTLFATLGAKPSGELDRWDRTAISAVRFSIDDRQFRAVCDGTRRALFDSEGRLLTASSSFGEWTRAFSNLVGFNLVLTRKNETSAQADPSCFFVPFYIDQDHGWGKDWSTFASIRQFNRPIQPILEYFSGVRPPEYYKARAESDEEQQHLTELKRELSFLRRAQDRVGAQLSQTGPKMEAQNFEAEVARLTQEMTELNRRQEKLRKAAAEQTDLIAMMTRQITAAAAALKEHDGDIQFIRTLSTEPLVCPVCQAQHDESYLELLSFAEDARSLREMAATLTEHREEEIRRYNQTRAQILELVSQYQRVEAILDTQRGEIRFRDVVESRGAERAFAVFEEERQRMDKEIAASEAILATKREEMKKWTDRKRQQAITTAFKNAYAMALDALNMRQEKITSLAGRPKLSGSGGPRAILAYHSALWSVCVDGEAAFVNPIVVDSPNQQGQDGENLPLVLEYVSLKLPRSGQIIVGSELPIAHPFDRTITLDRPYQVLSDEQYEPAVAEVGGLLRTMYAALENDTTNSGSN